MVEVDEVLKVLRKHINEFNSFVDNDAQYKSEVDQRQSVMIDNLAALPQIAMSLKNIEGTVASTRDNLIAPATGVDRMDLKAVYLIIALCVFMVLVLGVVIIVDKVAQTGTSVSGKSAVASFDIDNRSK